MTCLNAALEFLLAPTVHSWKERGVGFQLKCDPSNKDHECVYHSIQNWVDDFFVFAKTPKELQLMLDEFEAALVPLGITATNLTGCWLGGISVGRLSKGERLCKGFPR